MDSCGGWDSRAPPAPWPEPETEGLDRPPHSYSGPLSPPKPAFPPFSALFLTISYFCQSLFLVRLFIGHFFHSFALPIYVDADLCASPSSPSCRFQSVAWSWPMLCPFWPSGAAAHLLSSSPPPVRPLALDTDGKRLLTLEKHVSCLTPAHKSIILTASGTVPAAIHDCEL